MDEEPSNGNQALVIKEQALTAQETGDGNIMVQFDTTATTWIVHISIMIRPQLVMVKVI
jgi:hypothetical protein